MCAQLRTLCMEDSIHPSTASRCVFVWGAQPWGWDTVYTYTHTSLPPRQTNVCMCCCELACALQNARPTWSSWPVVPVGVCSQGRAHAHIYIRTCISMCRPTRPSWPPVATDAPTSLPPLPTPALVTAVPWLPAPASPCRCVDADVCVWTQMCVCVRRDEHPCVYDCTCIRLG